MRFAHIADCHVGSWKEQKLRDVNLRAFEAAVDMSVERGVDFVLLSGDLFNTAVPALDCLKAVVTKLRQLKESDTPVYAIAGSHDFSPSGKTMLQVLDEAGLLVNVAKGGVADGKLRLEFTKDSKTGAKITGIMGKRGMLDRVYYESLDTQALESEEGFKIFMFHTAITELKGRDMEHMDSSPISFLPKGFDYYAGGHVHCVLERDVDGFGKIVFPGPVWGNNFREVESGLGSFCIYDNGRLEFEQLNPVNITSFRFDCGGKNPVQIGEEMENAISKKEFVNTVVCLRLSGRIDGRLAEIDFRKIIDTLYSKGAYFVMRNSQKLESKDFEAIAVDIMPSADVEEKIIGEHVGQKGTFPIERERQLVKGLLGAASAEKLESEKSQDYEKRINTEIEKTISSYI